jgi:hypothetical protein
MPTRHPRPSPSHQDRSLRQRGCHVPVKFLQMASCCVGVRSLVRQWRQIRLVEWCCASRLLYAFERSSLSGREWPSVTPLEGSGLRIVGHGSVVSWALVLTALHFRRRGLESLEGLTVVALQ